MDINNINVKEISNLAKLDINDVKDNIKDILQILKFAESLNELDTLQIDPMLSINKPIELEDLREDKAFITIQSKDALKNAPATKGSFFTAPKVLNK